MSEFYSDRTRSDRKCQYCKSCFKARAKERYKGDKEKYKSWGSKNYRKVKREVMDAYGGVCQCCGEARIEFLTLDHINQDGAEHRRNTDPNTSCTGYNFYLRLRREGFPDWGLQVLCANCNTAKGAYGECPHVTERKLAAQE